MASMVGHQIGKLLIKGPFLINGGRIACEFTNPLVDQRVPTFQFILLDVSDDCRGSLLRAVERELESLDSSRFISATGHVFSFSAARWGRQTFALKNKK